MLKAAALLAVVALVAGCGGSLATSRTPSRNVHANSVKYTLEGVTLKVPPAGYRPSVSRSEVLALFRTTDFARTFPGTPTVRLWTVKQAAGGGGYPAWVLTVSHTKPTTPEGGKTQPECASVAVYDLATRVWTWQFQDCPPHDASCNYGCTPADQNPLDTAVEDAKKAAGPAYYTGAIVDETANTATIDLSRAPESVLDHLRALHPRIYVLHNDAPRPRSVVLKAMTKIDPNRLKAEGIDVVEWGPTEDGYLRIGVSSDVAQAQAAFNAMFGPGFVRVVKGEPAVATPYRSAPAGLNFHTSPPPLTRNLELTRDVPCPTGKDQLGVKQLKRLRAVTAVTCGEGVRIFPGDGQWEVLLRRVAVTSVSRLQQYYEQPGEPNMPKNGACLLNLLIVPPVAFVDANGRWLVPRTPADGCGHPLAGRKRVHIRWHIVSVRKVRLLVSAPALAAHCAMEIKDLPAGAIGPLPPTKGGPLFAVTPKTVGVCIYRTAPGDSEVGHFVRGFTLDTAQTRRLLGALTGSAPRGGCPSQRLFAIVGPKNEDGVEVELGGCFRVARSYRGYSLGSADASVMRAILGLG